MSIELLKPILAPPAEPLEAQFAVSEWASLEERFGLRLPGNYRDFVKSYGTGSVDDFIWVCNPFSSNVNLRLEAQIQMTTDAFRELKPMFGLDFPFELYPSSHGLLPFAGTDNVREP